MKRLSEWTWQAREARLINLITEYETLARIADEQLAKYDKETKRSKSLRLERDRYADTAELLADLREVEAEFEHHG